MISLILWVTFFKDQNENRAKTSLQIEKADWLLLEGKGMGKWPKWIEEINFIIIDGKLVF